MNIVCFDVELNHVRPNDMERDLAMKLEMNDLTAEDIISIVPINGSSFIRVICKKSLGPKEIVILTIPLLFDAVHGSNSDPINYALDSHGYRAEDLFFAREVHRGGHMFLEMYVKTEKN